jgi:hypothetical protein
MGDRRIVTYFTRTDANASYVFCGTNTKRDSLFYRSIDQSKVGRGADKRGIITETKKEKAGKEQWFFLECKRASLLK